MIEEVKKERIRKESIKRGEVTQRMFNFRCDLENWEWLQQQPNKGRALNELIRKERSKK